jgi:hypothetical protein
VFINSCCIYSALLNQFEFSLTVAYSSVNHQPSQPWEIHMTVYMCVLNTKRHESASNNPTPHKHMHIHQHIHSPTSSQDMRDMFLSTLILNDFHVLPQVPDQMCHHRTALNPGPCSGVWDNSRLGLGRSKAPFWEECSGSRRVQGMILMGRLYCCKTANSPCTLCEQWRSIKNIMALLWQAGGRLNKTLWPSPY